MIVDRCAAKQPEALVSAPINPSLFAPIGIGALILWRFYSRTPAGSPSNYATTPLTLLIFGTLAGYVTYAVGLIRWQGVTFP
jgi:hypothetical protein